MAEQSQWIYEVVLQYATVAIEVLVSYMHFVPHCVPVQVGYSVYVLTPLSPLWPCPLAGEASHMDRECDWEVFSQSCGDQGEGNDERHTNVNTLTYSNSLFSPHSPI